MTATDQKLFPGQFFLERQTGGKWEVLSRDNDEAVIKTRLDYAVEKLTKGQSVRLFSPLRELLVQKEFGTA